MSTRNEVLAGVTGSAAFGMMACMGLGLSRTEGAEPWLAGTLALLLAMPGLSSRINPGRTALGAAALADGLRGDHPQRASAWGIITVGLFIVHLALWLALGIRLWPLGLLVAATAIARVLFEGLAFARESTVPRWSEPPTVPLMLVQAAAAGLLGLSAIEGMLGYPPSLVLWKAAIAMLALGLMGQLWESQAGTVQAEGPAVRTDTLAATARAREKTLFWVAAGAGVGLPLALAIVADGQTERLLLPLALLSHLAGLAAHRLLFLALAREAAPAAQ